MPRVNASCKGDRILKRVRARWRLGNWKWLRFKKICVVLVRVAKTSASIKSNAYAPSGCTAVTVFCHWARCCRGVMWQSAGISINGHACIMPCIIRVLVRYPPIVRATSTANMSEITDVFLRATRRIKIVYLELQGITSSTPAEQTCRTGIIGMWSTVPGNGVPNCSILC